MFSLPRTSPVVFLWNNVWENEGARLVPVAQSHGPALSHLHGLPTGFTAYPSLVSEYGESGSLTVLCISDVDVADGRNQRETSCSPRITSKTTSRRTGAQKTSSRCTEVCRISQSHAAARSPASRAVCWANWAWAAFGARRRRCTSLTRGRCSTTIRTRTRTAWRSWTQRTGFRWIPEHSVPSHLKPKSVPCQAFLESCHLFVEFRVLRLCNCASECHEKRPIAAKKKSVVFEWLNPFVQIRFFFKCDREGTITLVDNVSTVNAFRRFVMFCPSTKNSSTANFANHSPRFDPACFFGRIASETILLGPQHWTEALWWYFSMFVTIVPCSLHAGCEIMLCRWGTFSKEIIVFTMLDKSKFGGTVRLDIFVEKKPRNCCLVASVFGGSRVEYHDCHAGLCYGWTFLW